MIRLVPHGIAARMALVMLSLVGLAQLIIAVGILGFGRLTFERLMVESGLDLSLTRSMYEHAVTLFFVGASAAAALTSVTLAIVFGRRLMAPLARLGVAARRVAEGDYAARVARDGPEELTSLADSFNQMAARLADQEMIRREFIANAAHELRTPLTNLVGYLEALRDAVVPPAPETFESLREEADRLVRLARSLEVLAVGDDPATRPRALVEVDLATAIAMAVAIAQPAFERRRIRIERAVPATLPARADADHLAQVLANLLQNASRYTPEGGRVVVAGEARPDDVLVSVTNTGEGIPPEDLPHVFERFYRVEKSRDRARGGAGIGLAIVKRLVELGGGRVGAESAAGLTRFWFCLPA